MPVELQLREDLVAVELGHQDVEQHQVELPATQELQRLAAVLCEDNGVPLLLQATAEQEPVHPVVVRDEDRSGRRGGSTHDAGVERSAASVFSSAAYSCSIRSRSSAVPSSSPLRACASSSRHSSEKRRAPKISPFDFRVCAARRSASWSPCSWVVRSVTTSTGASLGNVSITS